MKKILLKILKKNKTKYNKRNRKMGIGSNYIKIQKFLCKNMKNLKKELKLEKNNT